jgi:hypothetical protein
VAIERLKIFVSGKEGELDNERAIIIELVVKLGFEPVSSERRAASSMSMKERYVTEVLDSDIYVGVFGMCESDASINEFKKAGEYGKPTLVFIKELKEIPQPKMEQFIKEIMDESSGIVYKTFKVVTDLRDKAHDAIIETITKRFRKESKGEI